MTPTRRPDPLDDDPVVRLRRKRRRGRGRHRRSALVSGTLAVALVCGIAAAAVSGTVAFSASCDLNALRPVAIGENSFVYAADGSLLGAIPAERNRQPVELGEISDWMARATVAIEDRRFYQHGGIDAEGIARALWADVKAGKVVQGGSTITQQLVRNLYISRERTVQRKLKEACLAVKLNRAWSKDRILAAYMNQVYYGSLAYGIEAAAQTYFSKHAKELTLSEAALLAGLPQAPSEYDPFNASGKALARRTQVLDALFENGDITKAQRDAAFSEPVRLKPGKLYTRIREPYFFSFVRDQLIAEYGAATVRSGGLEVYTTIDPRLQRAAQSAIRRTLDRGDDPAAALVSINPANGAIRAMTAVTPGSKGNQFNLASQARRQSGSTFKTFVLTAAVEQGINPATTSYVSAPFRYQPDALTPAWDVSTYGHTYLGWTTIERATIASDNTVFAQLTLDVGPERVAAMATKLGVRTPLDVDGAFVPSLGLGALAVSPLDMASAYATLAAGGVYSEPMAIRRVVLATGSADTDAGWGKPRRTRVIPDGVAYTVTRILEKNVQYGTGTGARLDRPAAGKTGTTDEHADAWFIGYTPTLATTVWVGYPQGEIPMRSVHGISVAGGTFPATIWRLFMEVALARTPPTDFREPKVWPEWKPFTRGQYALGWAPATVEATTAEHVSLAEEPDPRLPPVKPEPATTAELPPATTVPPPPPTTATPAPTVVVTTAPAPPTVTPTEPPP